jgi:hypothetical protein
LDYLKDSLQRKLIFFTGKGGVGKSTLAWSTALAAHRKGMKTAVVGWNPLGKEQPLPVVRENGLEWIGLETLSAFREYALQIIRFEKLYDSVLDNKVLRTFVQAAPGLADVVIAGKILDLHRKNLYDLILVDLPSSGHARSFFKSPLGLQKIFKVGFVARDLTAICQLFQEPTTRLDLVALPEELPLVECAELKTALSALHPFSFGYLHLNQCLPIWANTERQTDLPPSVESVLENFREQAKEESLLLPLAQKVGLPILPIPRVAALNWENNVDEVANYLESI